MLIKRVQCPSCGQVLEVQNQNNETTKKFHCPKCKALLQTTFPLQQEPLEAKTYLGPKRSFADMGATRLSARNTASTRLITPNVRPDAEPILECVGHSYPLKEGQNIVGRKCSSSKATVQIDTNDIYMSRQHCIINVCTLPNGIKKVGLSNYQNKNRTFIDEQLIDNEDEICLVDGNKIKMGNTVVTFKLS